MADVINGQWAENYCPGCEDKDFEVNLQEWDAMYQLIVNGYCPKCTRGWQIDLLTPRELKPLDNVIIICKEY